jgi:hypothetical protein
MLVMIVTVMMIMVMMMVVIGSDYCGKKIQSSLCRVLVLSKFTW